MELKSKPTNHPLVFTLLVLLLLAAVGIHLSHPSAMLNNFGVVGIALVMAALVVLQYMGLKREGGLIVSIMIVPLILFIILMVILLPDLDGLSLHWLKGM